MGAGRGLLAFSLLLTGNADGRLGTDAEPAPVDFLPARCTLTEAVVTEPCQRGDDGPQSPGCELTLRVDHLLLLHRIDPRESPDRLVQRHRTGSVFGCAHEGFELVAQAEKQSPELRALRVGHGVSAEDPRGRRPWAAQSASGGASRSRGESVGSAIGQRIPILGSFHAIAISCSGA